MSKRSLDNRGYTPDELNILCRAYQRVCADCDLTGPAGRTLLARALITRFRHGTTCEDDLVAAARAIVWRKRGLAGNAPGVTPLARRRRTSPR